MSEFSFSIFPNENFMDFRLYQYGWEQCEPLHSFGPFVRNHFLFHYILSGHGQLDATDSSGISRAYQLGPGQGFLIFPDQVTTYAAQENDPWKYVWLEFDGLRVAEYVEQSGLSLDQPIYRPVTAEQGQQLGETMLYITDHSVKRLCIWWDICACSWTAWFSPQPAVRNSAADSFGTTTSRRPSISWSATTPGS